MENINTKILKNLKELIGKEINGDDVIEAFEDFDEGYGTYFDESENNGYDYIAYINKSESVQYLFDVDKNDIILDVWSYDPATSSYTF